MIEKEGVLELRPHNSTESYLLQLIPKLILPTKRVVTSVLILSNGGCQKKKKNSLIKYTTNLIAMYTVNSEI